ncbi:MAG: glycosyltransferase family 4 protein, partial [Acidobacteriaceae bacterium]
MAAGKQNTFPQPLPHLVLIVTSSLSAGFFRGQIARLCQAGYRITFICSPGPQIAELEAEGADIIPIPIEREISPWRDLQSLWQLWRTLRRLRPDITNVGTPKAGLLGGIAAMLARVPCRIYTLHGLRMETAHGSKRRLLLWAEWLACKSAHHVRCVSPSLRNKAIALGLLGAGADDTKHKAYVVGPGTANGIAIDQFRATPERAVLAQNLRKRWDIPAGALVIGFAGRFTRDKGIPELYAAFKKLLRDFPQARLLLLGSFEDGDPVSAELRSEIASHPCVILPGFVEDIAPDYQAMDLFVLPSHREGFPVATLEAQASSLPVVTTDATGTRDSVLDGLTGLLFPVGDLSALHAALDTLLRDPELRERMGKTGAQWVAANFSQADIWESLRRDYQRIIQLEKP